VALLRNPNKPAEAYPRYPSVLYKDGIIKGGNLFCSAAIVNVSTLTLFLRVQSLIPSIDT